MGRQTNAFPPAERQAFQALHAQALLEHAARVGEADARSRLSCSRTRFHVPQLQAAYQDGYQAVARVAS